jgi:hypothetical protein
MAVEERHPEEALVAPYDAIIDWANANIPESGIPTPETLEEVRRALHAIAEFLLEPISKTFRQLGERDDGMVGTVGKLAEAERLVTYEDIGRLTVWTDELRGDCGYILDEIETITFCVREDFRALADGCSTDRFWAVPEQRARLREFYGLDHSRAW